MELDIYLPREKLALEYQGQQHYTDIHTLGPQWIQREKDEEKRKQCSKKGITLIEVPFWWDFTISGLMTEIHLERPDLIPFSGHTESLVGKPSQDISKGSLCIFDYKSSIR